MPSVSAAAPTNGTIGASPSSTVSLTFSGAIDPNTVNSNTVQLLNAGNFVIPASVSYNTTNHTAELWSPTNSLAAATYTVIVHGGTTGASADG